MTVFAAFVTLQWFILTHRSHCCCLPLYWPRSDGEPEREAGGSWGGALLQRHRPAQAAKVSMHSKLICIIPNNVPASCPSDMRFSVSVLYAADRQLRYMTVYSTPALLYVFVLHGVFAQYSGTSTGRARRSFWTCPRLRSTPAPTSGRWPW